MGRSRFTRDRRQRVLSRAACAILALALVAAAGCGDDGGHGADTDSEVASDVEILNAALSQELTILDAYTQGQRLLKGRSAAAGRRFRAQEQEYVSALTKAIRGLGGETDAEGAELDLSEMKTQADILALAYELESAALAAYIDAAARLYTDAPQTLVASLAAGHAQHLVLLRQGLGVAAADSAPEAFDGGEVPPPGPMADSDPG